MPKVRVFTPGREAESMNEGVDFNFAAIPRIGELLRFTDHRAADFVVTQVGHVQDGKTFVAAVWTEVTAEDRISELIEAYTPPLG